MNFKSSWKSQAEYIVSDEFKCICSKWGLMSEFIFYFSFRQKSLSGPRKDHATMFLQSCEASVARNYFHFVPGKYAKFTGELVCWFIYVIWCEQRGGNVFLTQLILLNLLWFTEKIYWIIKIDLPSYVEEYKGPFLAVFILNSPKMQHRISIIHGIPFGQLKSPSVKRTAITYHVHLLIDHILTTVYLN